MDIFFWLNLYQIRFKAFIKTHGREPTHKERGDICENICNEADEYDRNSTA